MDDQLKTKYAFPDMEQQTLANRCLTLEQELLKIREHSVLSYGSAYDNFSLYFDFGNGYSETDKQSVMILLQPYMEISVSFNIPEGVKALRLDPGEIPCFLTDVSTSLGSLQPINGTPFKKNSFLFDCHDPLFNVNIDTPIQPNTVLTFSCRYYPFPLKESDSLITVICDNLVNTVMTAGKDISVLKQENQHLRSNLSDVTAQLSNCNASLMQTADVLSQTRDVLSQTRDALSDAELSYASENSRAQSLEETVSALNHHVITLEQALNEKDHVISSLMSSTSWKLTAPLRAVTRIFHRS